MSVVFPQPGGPTTMLDRRSLPPRSVSSCWRYGERGSPGQGDPQAMGAVDPPGRSTDGVDRAQATSARLGVGDPRAGDDDDPVPGQLGPPAEVDVVAEDREGRVESAEPVPDVAPDQQPGRAHGEDVVSMVLLALVALPGLDIGQPAAAG